MCIDKLGRSRLGAGLLGLSDGTPASHPGLHQVRGVGSTDTRQLVEVGQNTLDRLATAGGAAAWLLVSHLDVGDRRPVNPASLQNEVEAEAANPPPSHTPLVHCPIRQDTLACPPVHSRRVYTEVCSDLGGVTEWW